MARRARKGIKSFCLQNSGENLLLLPWGCVPPCCSPSLGSKAHPGVLTDTDMALPGDHPGILPCLKGHCTPVPWLCSLGALYSSTVGSAVHFGALVWGKLMCLGWMRVSCNSQEPSSGGCPSAALSSGLWPFSQRSLPGNEHCRLPCHGHFSGSCQESGVEFLGRPP